MTIDVIGIGAAPGDNTGDGLRTAMAKVNNNFGSSANAASKLVGTATGKIPTAVELSMVGAIENFTSNNLNPNVFGGEGTGLDVATGTPASASVAEFHLPVSINNSAPSSITVVGTFDIRDGFDNLIASNVTPALFGKSSNKLALVRATGSGMIANQSLRLVTNSPTSKITVNY